MFDNGQLDVVDASGDYIAKYDAEVESGDLQVMDVEYPGTAMLCFEHQNGGLSGLMQNVNIRKAISYSINREEMVLGCIWKIHSCVRTGISWRSL